MLQSHRTWTSGEVKSESKKPILIHRFVAKLKAKERLVTMDIRTPGETEGIGASLPESLTLPFNKLCKRQNLDQIPTDETVVILCKSGKRSGAAGAVLRHIGFDNVF
jgi:rhodanese-related sulfurtransferase